MIFVCIVSCVMLLYWGGCAVDTDVIPLLFALTDGRFPKPNAFGYPPALFTSWLNDSQLVFIIVQLSVFLLEIITLLYVLLKKGVPYNCKTVACFGAVCLLVFVVCPVGRGLIILAKALAFAVQVVLVGKYLHQRRKAKQSEENPIS